MRKNKARAYIAPKGCYVGVRGEFSVSVYFENEHAESFPLPLYDWILAYSSSGFEWSEVCNGSAQLALAILAHYTQSDSVARTLHLQFGADVVEAAPKAGFRLDLDVVGHWLVAHGFSNDNVAQTWVPIAEDWQPMN
jgi:hypothetical protein